MYIVVLLDTNPGNLCSIPFPVVVVDDRTRAFARQRGHGRVTRDQVGIHVANFCYALAVILTVALTVVIPPVNCHEIVAHPV